MPPVIAEPPPLTSKRMHEVCGISRVVFAARRAAKAERIIWISDPAHREWLYPHGLAEFCDPARLTTIRPANRKDTLWCMEQALRESGVMVVAGLSAPADLTESRRLQLAAETGGSTGLCLIPDVPVNNAAETRWRSIPLCRQSPSTSHRWELIKNKKGMLGCWDID